MKGNEIWKTCLEMHGGRYVFTQELSDLNLSELSTADLRIKWQREQNSKISLESKTKGLGRLGRTSSN